MTPTDDSVRADGRAALPIACTLGPDDLAARVLRWRAVIAAHRVDAERGPGEMVLRFRPDAADELDQLVAAERECCAFLDWSLTEEADVIVLTVSGEVDALPGGLAAT